MIRVVVLAIGALTMVTGAVQLLLPALVLRAVGGETTAGATHFFGIVGLFMVLFGGLLWQGARPTPPSSLALGWAALQKLGASTAVAVGVTRHVFSALALVVASFDFASFLLIAWYWRKAAR